jgi:AbrB family looped-hinge helix DNA binding protein
MDSLSTPPADLALESIDRSFNRTTMETVTISPKYQVVIPRSVREALGLRAGQKAHVIPYQGRIEVIPVRDIRKLRGFLKGMDTSLDLEADRL